MKILNTIKELKTLVSALKKDGKNIALVPTMGALHHGHVSLFRNAKKENDIVIGTIFVNRIQFNNPKDFDSYPKTPEKDIKTIQEAGCDILLIPSEEEVYAGMEDIKVNLGHLDQIMEARYRPGHFEGVAKVVYRFFEIVEPDVAYFGQKDIQQVKVIERMVQQYNLPVQVKMCPIIREDDGLAMSSRNVRLTKEARELAPKIYASLIYAGDLLQFADQPEQVKKKVASFIEKFKPLKLEYFEIADPETLKPVESVNEGQSLALCIAAYLEEVRLIDNIIINS